MRKLVCVIFVFLSLDSVFANPIPTCEYYGYSQDPAGYYLDDCHYIKNPNGGDQIPIACNLSLKDGLIAVAQKMKKFEAEGKCRIEAADCLVGAVRYPYYTPSGKQCYAVPAVWFKTNPEFQSAESSSGLGATFRRYNNSAEIKIPGDVFRYVGVPNWDCSLGTVDKIDLGAALKEAKEALEHLSREGICKAQQFPMACKQADLNWFPGIAYGSKYEIHMDGRIDFYLKAGICK